MNPAASRKSTSKSPSTMPLLSVADVAERLNVSEKTVRRQIKDGSLPSHRVGRNLRISEDDLRAYLNGCR